MSVFAENAANGGFVGDDSGGGSENGAKEADGVLCQNVSVDICSDEGDENEGMERLSRSVLLRHAERISSKGFRHRFVTCCELGTMD